MADTPDCASVAASDTCTEPAYQSVEQAEPLHAIVEAGAVVSSGCCEPPMTSCIVFTTTLLSPWRKSRNDERVAALVEYVSQPSQISWKTIGTRPPPALSARVTMASRSSSVVVSCTMSGVGMAYASSGGSAPAAG